MSQNTSLIPDVVWFSSLIPRKSEKTDFIRKAPRPSARSQDFGSVYWSNSLNKDVLKLFEAYPGIMRSLQKKFGCKQTADGLHYWLGLERIRKFWTLEFQTSLNLKTKTWTLNLVHSKPIENSSIQVHTTYFIQVSTDSDILKKSRKMLVKTLITSCQLLGYCSFHQHENTCNMQSYYDEYVVSTEYYRTVYCGTECVTYNT